MKASTLHYLAGALALSAFLAASEYVHASCSHSNRIRPENAACLDGSYSNRCTNRVFGACIAWNSSARAERKCTLSDGEKVVAKVDISGARDVTWDLSGEIVARSVQSDRKIRGVFCCNDRGRCN